MVQRYIFRDHFLLYKSVLEYIQHSAYDIRPVVEPCKFAQICVLWCQTSELGRLFDTLWVELQFSDVIKKFFIHSRFVSGNDFPGFWHMPKFLINICHMCYTAMTCVKSDKCAQTLISECQYMMKWVEPGFENQHTHRRRIGDSCLVIYFRR